MAFTQKFSDLVKCGIEVLREAEVMHKAGTLDRVPNARIGKSTDKCNRLLDMYLESAERSALVMKNILPFFKENIEHLNEPLTMEVDGELAIHNDEWLGAEDKPRGASGHRGLTMCPNAKSPTICFPLSEIYEISLDIAGADGDKDFYAARILYLFLMCMASVTCEDISTEDILLSAVELEEKSKIQGGDMMDGLKQLGIDKSVAEQLLKGVGGTDGFKDVNQIVELVGGTFNKYKAEGLPAVISQVQKFMGNGGAPEEGDAEDQD